MLRLLRINDLMAYKDRIDRLTAQGIDEMVAISVAMLRDLHRES